MIDISVIIPTYKPKDYIWKCLDSLVHQTLSHQQYEVIIILNGEKEPYNSQLLQYIHENQITTIFQFIYLEEGNVSNARNVGIDISNGQYITFIDDDDYVSESYLEALLKVATPSVVSLSNLIAFSDKTGDFVPHSHTDCFNQLHNKTDLKYYHVRKYFSGPVAKLVHRDIIGKTRFDKRFSIAEDCLFFFTISNQMSKVLFTTSDAIYYRRFREDSISLSRRSLKIRVSNLCKLCFQYCKIYCQGFPTYNFSFFVTRILGAIHAAIVKNHSAYSTYLKRHKIKQI